MNRFALLGVALGALLAVALLTSKVLVDAPLDQPASHVLPPPPTAELRAQPAPSASARLPEALLVGAAPASLPGPTPVPAAAAPAPTAMDPEPTPDAENPFASEDSPEIDYAFALVYGRASTVETARVAAEVFERCLRQAPDNHRCIRGLVAAQQRQQPDWTPPSEVRVPLAPLDSPTRTHGLRSRLPATAREAGN